MHSPATRTAVAPDPRAEEMSSRRLAGETLASIGKGFGLTRERVRQIIRDHGQVSIADVQAARQARVDQRRDDLRRRAAKTVRHRPGLTMAQLADLLGVSRGELSAAMDRETRALLVRDKHVEPQWTDEQVLGCLRRAAALHPGKPLTAKRYRQVRSIVGGPTSVRILQRFGTWLQACQEAGVEGGRRPARSYGRAWSEEELRGWVADYLALPSTRGTYAGYDQWARRIDGAPSAQTVRNRLGTWAAVKRAAAVLVVAREQARPTRPSLTLAA